MVADLAAALTPAPAGPPPIAERLHDTFAGWRRLAAVTGFLLDGARLPPPPGLPTLRAFQHGQGVVALDWLRRRTGWP